MRATNTYGLSIETSQALNKLHDNLAYCSILKLVPSAYVVGTFDTYVPHGPFR